MAIADGNFLSLFQGDSKMILKAECNQSIYLLAVILITSFIVDAAYADPIGGLSCNQSRSKSYTGLTATGISGWMRFKDQAEESAIKDCDLDLKNDSSQSAGPMTACINTCLLGSVRSCQKDRSFSLTNADNGRMHCNRREEERRPPISNGVTGVPVAFTIAHAFASFFTAYEHNCSITCSADVEVTDTCGDCSFCAGDDAINFSRGPSKSLSAEVCTINGYGITSDKLMENYIEAWELTDDIITPEDIRLYEKKCVLNKTPSKACQKVSALKKEKALDY